MKPIIAALAATIGIACSYVSLAAEPAHYHAASRVDIRSIEWLAPVSTSIDMWGYISPDGETITYSHSIDHGDTWELLVTSPTGKTPRPFFSSPPAARVTRAAWSRVHHQLAFTAGPNEVSSVANSAPDALSKKGQSGNPVRPVPRTDIFVTDAAGKTVKRVLAEGVSDHVVYPSWMPDGASLVVVDYGAPGGNTLYRIDIATGKSKALTNPKEVLVGMPSVSPDGKIVAFAGQANSGEAYDPTKNAIWFLPTDGVPREVSNGQGRQPDWSPDGRWLAFTSNRGDSNGRHAIFVMDRNAETLIQVTDYTSNAQHPVWSPDGRWILFSAQLQLGESFGLARITVPRLSE